MRTFFAILLSGCGMSIATTPINAPPRLMSSRLAATVEVFATAPPPRPHVDVALIDVELGLGSGGTAELIDEIRNRAAAMGCDAVTITGVISSHNKIGGLVATCVVYTG